MRPPRAANCDLSQWTTYHIVSRCARQMKLFAGASFEERNERKGILLAELERLAVHTAVGVAGFSFMDNHIHLLLKVDVDGARRWTDREVAERWLALHPPRSWRYKPLDVSEEHIAAVCADREKLETCREKLMSVSQFMKEFKQLVAQRINALDGVAGSLWAGRFKCKPVEDEAQLLATLAYIDLNPFAANVCETPESGEHTSLAARMGNISQQHEAAESKRKPKSKRRRSLQSITEHQGWWLPIETAKAKRSSRSTKSSKTALPHQTRGQQSARHGLIPGSSLTLAGYLRLLRTTAELFRPGKRRLRNTTTPITPDLPVGPKQIFERIEDIAAWVKPGATPMVSS